MRSHLSVLCFGIAMALSSLAFARPAASALDTSDVDLFYQLFDEAGGRPTADQLQTRYIEAGSDGLRTFFEARRTTAVRLAAAIATNPALYERARECSAVLPRAKENVDNALSKFVRLYPDARIPSVTIAIGRGRPVAIGSPITGIQVGLEALCATNFIDPIIQSRVEGVLVHEFVHAQQNPALTEKEHPTVLEAALTEGGAEFVTELLLGRPAYRYFGPLTQGREKMIEERFVESLDSTDISSWFYNSTPESPSDLGYWVGYRITKSYYAKARDKQAALREILTVSDGRTFLKASGWSPGITIK